jgi:hypothetical protein
VASEAAEVFAFLSRKTKANRRSIGWADPRE